MQNRTEQPVATGTALAAGTQSPADLQTRINELTGIYPAIDKILDGISDLAGLIATPERTAIALMALAGDPNGHDVIGLLADTLVRLTDQASNPGLAAIPAVRQQDIRERTAEFAAYVRDFLPRDLVVWTTWDLNPSTIPTSATA